MAVSISNLTAGSTTTDATSFTTASITPSANNLVLAFVHVSGTSPTPTPTLSGNGLTWVAVDQTSAGARTLHVFRAMGAAPTAGAVTISFGATTMTGCIWEICQASGVDTSGTNGSGAIVQSTQRQQSTNSFSWAFPTTLTAGNATACAVSNGNNATITAGTGWTGLAASTGINTPTSSMLAMKSDTGTQTIAATWTTSVASFAVGVEIKATPIALGSSASLAYSSTARTTSSVPVPSGVAANDVILVHFYTEDSTPTVTAPAGFTELTFTTAPQTSTQVHRQRVFWKRATGADSGTYAFTHASAITEALATRWTGCVTTGTPVEVLGSATSGSSGSTTSTAVSGTTSVADEQVVWGLTYYTGSATVTPPTGYAEVYDGSDIDLSYLNQPTAGATGSLTGTLSTTSVNASTLVGLQATSASSSFSGSVDLSGSGTLTTSGTPAVSGSVGLSGSGTLSLAGKPAFSGSTALSGAGTLTLAGTPAPTGTLALSGSGTLTLSGSAGAQSGSGTVALSGSGELTLTGVGHRVFAKFIPPTEASYFRMVPIPVTSRFFGTTPHGLAVWRVDGVWHTGRDPLPSDVEAADRYYPGGYEYELTPVEQAELTAAGFGAYITTTTEDL